MDYNASLQSNNVILQTLIDIANALPEAGGVELPTLTTPVSEAEVFEGYEYIDQEGAAKVGSFTIESELNEQDNLISQLQNMVDSLPEAGGVELPELTNPATSDKILEGYEAIDEDGNLILGTHVCEAGGGDGGGGVDFGSGAFTVFNSTDLYFALNGVECYPNEITAVPVSSYSVQSFVMINSDEWTIEEMSFDYEYEGDEGEIINERCYVYSPSFEDFIICGYSEICYDCTFTATYS